MRRDLWCLEAQGLRGVGYHVNQLHMLVSTTLGAQRPGRIAVAGAGNIGAALGHYSNLVASGFRIVAMFDSNPEKVGETIGGAVVYPANQIAQQCARLQVGIGVIATPADAAQEAADAFVSSGITALLNFVPVRLELPRRVSLRQVDLLAELQLLQHSAQSAEPS